MSFAGKGWGSGGGGLVECVGLVELGEVWRGFVYFVGRNGYGVVVRYLRLAWQGDVLCEKLIYEQDTQMGTRLELKVHNSF